MASAVAIAIRQREALDRLGGLVVDLSDRLGFVPPDRPQLPKDDRLHMAVTLEWFGDVLAAVPVPEPPPVAPKAAPKAKS